ncbi:MAG: sigma 54-interacting transcriptional regulator [Planctomycetota bacterium]
MANDDQRLRDELKTWLAAMLQAHGADALPQLAAMWQSVLEELGSANASPALAPGPTDAAAAPLDRERYAEIIGSSPAMLRVFAMLDKVAAANIPILIQGESGTGKELIAHAIHKGSPRAARAFVAENCAAVPETLLESELFGYKRGAFTGADREKKGLFEVAHGGTLFLDEIGDMSLGMQKKLLRALQDGEIRPVGGKEALHVDVRVVSASNKVLRNMVEKGTFREDLFYRLNTITIELPPLRERKEDIPLLADSFIARVAREMGIAKPDVTRGALEALARHNWPGNVRELENEIRRALALLPRGAPLDVDGLSDEVRRSAAG